MSLDDVFRDRHYTAGHLYIVGSRSARLLKIGVTARNVHDYVRTLRYKRYGDIRDWVLLYYVWVDGSAGDLEHQVRGNLPRTTRLYEKDGHQQRARELVNCDFSVAYQELKNVLSKDQAEGCISPGVEAYNFKQRERERRLMFETIAAEIEQERLAKVVLAANRLEQARQFDKTPFVRSVHDLGLSRRATNALFNADIMFVGDLVQKTQAELLRTHNFGRKLLNEVTEVLERLGLKFGTAIPGWPSLKL